MLTCSVDSLAAEVIISPFLRREMFVMEGYFPVAEQASMVFSFVPFNCRVNKECSAAGKMLMSESIGCNNFTTSIHRLTIILKLKLYLGKNSIICSDCMINKCIV